MMLGFGATEVETEEVIKKMVVAALARGESQYTVSNEWNAENSYTTESEHLPQRFTTFNVYGGAIRFIHTNTQHPYSDDGWAAMQVHWVFDQEEYERGDDE